jgi:hypothetical protein
MKIYSKEQANWYLDQNKISKNTITKESLKKENFKDMVFFLSSKTTILFYNTMDILEMENSMARKAHVQKWRHLRRVSLKMAKNTEEESIVMIMGTSMKEDFAKIKNMIPNVS